MKLARCLALALMVAAVNAPRSFALEKPDVTYKVFQFPTDKIPRIDGNTDDWSMVPDSYVVGSDQLTDTLKKYPKPDPKNLDVRVKVGWVKGLNRLYFLYEASDNYWDFSLPTLHNDTFEIVVDGDASGGPLIDKGHRELWIPEEVGSAAAPDDRISVPEAHWAIHGVQAQNYHIFTPSVNKDWCMAWSAASWIKEFPWANSAQSFNFKPGEGGKYTLEFWVTAFDYAGPEGPQRAVESNFSENKIIGLSWAILEYDDVASRTYDAFWNLSPKHMMYGNASSLCAFKLMPLEPQFLKKLEARWSFKVVDLSRRLVAFKDESVGQVTAWKWDFGDGTNSTEQHPTHAFGRAGSFVTILDVTGPDGTSRRSKVWDVQLK